MPIVFAIKSRDDVLSVEEVGSLDGHRRKLTGWLFYASGSIAIALAVWHLWLASYGVMGTAHIRYIHLGILMALVFVHFAATPATARSNPGALDITLSLLSLFLTVYCVVEANNIAMRVGAGYWLDMVVGGIIILLVLEMTRRTCGLAMPILALIAILYAFAGPWMPSILGHRGYGFERLIDHIFISTDGIYGLPIGISATLVAVFMIFSAALETTGSGNVFIKLASALVGGYRGGPAKAAILASGMFGSFSGSATANVVGTGSITIPMMKKLGYKPHFAGAVEAVASTGGLVMPPVMAAGAFLIAEFLGIPYIDVVIAAIFPAFLYFWSVGLMVHLEAVKTGLVGQPRNELPSFWDTLRRGWPLMTPVLILFFLLGYQHQSPAKAAFWAVIALWIIFALFYDRKFDAAKLLTALRKGGESMLAVGAVCACAGILIGVFSITGLAFRMSTMMVEISGGSLPILLVLTMITSFILGMGMPPTASYIVLVLLVVPSLTEQGITPIASHLFVFYFANISNITPPVAIAAYAASGIAKASAWQIGWTAFRLGAAAYIVPYMFIYGNQLLMIGAWWNVALAVITATIGCVGLAAAVQAYLFHRLNWMLRLTAFASALLLIKPGLYTDISGVSLLALVGWVNWRQSKALTPASAEMEPSENKRAQENPAGTAESVPSSSSGGMS